MIFKVIIIIIALGDKNKQRAIQHDSTQPLLDT